MIKFLLKKPLSLILFNLLISSSYQDANADFSDREILSTLQEVFQEHVKNGTLINELPTNEKLLNQTFTNETLTDQTLTNEKFASQTLTNDTLTNNQTLTNETLTNNQMLTSKTLTNETLANENLTNETLVNETLINQGGVSKNQSLNETLISTNSTLVSTNETLNLAEDGAIDEEDPFDEECFHEIYAWAENLLNRIFSIQNHVKFQLHANMGPNQSRRRNFLRKSLSILQSLSREIIELEIEDAETDDEIDKENLLKFERDLNKLGWMLYRTKQYWRLDTCCYQRWSDLEFKCGERRMLAFW